MSDSGKGRFPMELMLSIFCHLDGPTLCVCKEVCQAWRRAIDHYDDVIWSCVCSTLTSNKHQLRFRWLQFPRPSLKRNWQDMYRITYNWYHGHCQAYYPTIDKNYIHASSRPYTIIGSVQEQGMFTTLSVSNDGRIIRSNPNYHGPSGAQRLVIQSPLDPHSRFFLETTHGWPEAARAIVCHYSQPGTKWLATGSLNGTVAVWDLEQKKLARVWQGHRGRVLCISMNDQVVVSGGSDNMVRVFDLDEGGGGSGGGAEGPYQDEWMNHHHRRTRRGMIDVSEYLSSTSEWYQGVGEIAVNGNLVACAPDASGPILVFSLLTGTRVYELKVPLEPSVNEWVSQDITAFTRLCLSPFFLLTKGKVVNDNHQRIPLIPSDHNVVLQRTNKKKTEQSMGYTSRLSDSHLPNMPTSQMTPYQLYQYYQNQNNTSTNNHREGEEGEQEQEEEKDKVTKPIPPTSACINVWDLQTGKMMYRLVPTLKRPQQYYTITDIKLSPDYSKVYCSIDIRENQEYQEYLYCWDFAIRHKESPIEQVGFVELDRPDPISRTCGKSWVCFM